MSDPEKITTTLTNRQVMNLILQNYEMAAHFIRLLPQLEQIQLQLTDDRGRWLDQLEFEGLVDIHDRIHCITASIHHLFTYMEEKKWSDVQPMPAVQQQAR